MSHYAASISHLRQMAQRCREAAHRLRDADERDGLYRLAEQCDGKARERESVDEVLAAD